MANPHIEILADDTVLTPAVRQALRRINATFDLRPLDDDTPANGVRSMNARLVVTKHPRWHAGSKLDKLLGRVRDHPCPTLIYSEGPSDPPPAPALVDEAVAVGWAWNLSEDALAGHLSAMCTIGGAMASMRRQMSAMRGREESLRLKVNRLGGDLKRAADLQRDLLPAVLPDIRGLDVHTLYRPAETVSGDSYDVVRVSPTNVAFTVADATGHGVAAGLLCASFLRSLRRLPGTDTRRPAIEPAAILRDLNREIYDADLSECQFVTAIHADYDELRGVVRWARAGAPYPILIRPGLGPTLLHSEGPAAGLVEDPAIETVETRLEPGDVLVFHTDGLGEALLDADRIRRGESIAQTRWYHALAQVSFRRSLVELDGILAAPDASGERHDDTTIVALERRAEQITVSAVDTGRADRAHQPVMV